MHARAKPWLRRARGLALALALAVGALAADSLAQETPAKKTLQRTEDPVVLAGARLPKLHGVHRDQLRLYAWREGKLGAIPFQVDERTPELNYCWTTGPDPVKSMDEGRVNDDCELVFMARDSGDRLPDGVVLPAGSTARQEIELADPKTGERAWAYALAFADPSRPPPAGSPVRYASLVRERGAATFRTDTFEIATTASAGAPGRPEHVRLRAADGTLSRELVTNAARGHFHASYLFVHIDRDDVEARCSLGTSWIDGPVRVVAPVAIEAYVVWGNWITAVRSVLFVYRSRWEHHARLSVPVNLDANEASYAWIGLELAPGVEGLSFSNDRNPLGASLAPGAAREHLDTTFPSWNAVFGPEGGVVSGLKLDPRLSSARSQLHLEPASAHAGARVGFRVDLTGLKKSDDGAPYAVDYWAAFVPGYRTGDEARFVEIDEAPLLATVR